MKFISNLPNTYQKATIEGKQRLLRMIIEKVTYDTETQKMSVKLKPIFQALRMAKQNEKYKSEKDTTLILPVIWFKYFYHLGEVRFEPMMVKTHIYIAF